MPRFFDDYSNTYLTHDSAAGRKQQRRGWKFRENFKLHYEAHLDEWRSGPMGLASAQQVFIKNNPAAVPPLPQGWREEYDEVTRTPFYINLETKERQWNRPAFIPPGPGGMPPPMMQQHVPLPIPMSAPPTVGVNLNIPPPGPPPVFNLPPPGTLPPPPPVNLPPPGVLPPHLQQTKH